MHDQAYNALPVSRLKTCTVSRSKLKDTLSPILRLLDQEHSTFTSLPSTLTVATASPPRGSNTYTSPRISPWAGSRWMEISLGRMPRLAAAPTGSWRSAAARRSLHCSEKPAPEM